MFPLDLLTLQPVFQSLTTFAELSGDQTFQHGWLAVFIYKLYMHVCVDTYG